MPPNMFTITSAICIPDRDEKRLHIGIWSKRSSGAVLNIKLTCSINFKRRECPRE